MRGINGTVAGYGETQQLWRDAAWEETYILKESRTAKVLLCGDMAALCEWMDGSASKIVKRCRKKWRMHGKNEAGNTEMKQAQPHRERNGGGIYKVAPKSSFNGHFGYEYGAAYKCTQGT